MDTSRRGFLKQTLTTSGALVVPYVLTSQRTIAQDLNSKPTVAAIGVGGSRGRYSQGGEIAHNAAEYGKMIAVCDVDDLHTAEFNEEFEGKLSTFRDYRVLFEKVRPDVVTIGTPDHWHVPIAITAMRAGCDVYCEKPLTLTINEGKEVCRVVRETGRVFQVGTQQRSQDELRFLKAIAIVQSGRLGKSVNAYLAIGNPPVEGPFATSPPPADLDWEMWVGPAPKVEYSEERRKMFRWFFEYSGGKMTDWGAHHIDIAQWALGKSTDGPVSVKGTGSFPPIIPGGFDWHAFLDGEATLPNAYNTPEEFSIDLTFDDGSIINVNNSYQRDDGTEFDNGILFEGDAGRIFVNRGKLVGAPVDALTDSDEREINKMIMTLYKGKMPGDHMRNFFECLEDRQQPISDVFTHHRTMVSCHLCNIALMLARELKWDPKVEEFLGDDQATELMSRRSHDLPAI